jgi:hypothetical protein
LQATGATGRGRLCYFAHYHPAGIVADYVVHYLAELRTAGFETVVASTAQLHEAEAEKLRSACDHLLLRENKGLDFGSWIDCYAARPPGAAELLLLCNDSVYGPVDSLAACIERLTRTDADFYGLVGNEQMGRHVQSWFVVLRPTAFESEPFRALFSAPVPEGLAKDEVIRRYEVGLSLRMHAAGLASHVLYDAARDGLLSRKVPFNPTHFLWEEMVGELGIPFLKVDLLRDNGLFVDDVERWRDVVAARSPALVAPIAADIAARRAAAARRAEPEGGLGRAMLIVYLRWFRRCAVRDYRYVRDGRRLLAALNAACFSAGLFLYRALLKAAKTARLMR